VTRGGDGSGDTEAIKRWWNQFRLLHSSRTLHCGGGPVLPCVSGRRACGGQSLALAMVRTEYPRKLTNTIAEFLRTILSA